MVVAESSRDPDIAPFVGPVHLGQALVIATGDRRPALAYFTSMEREEAAKTGCTLLHPEQFDLTNLRKRHGSGHLFWAAVMEAGLAFAEVPPSEVALAGRTSNGLVHAACAILETRGWEFTDGSLVARSYRKLKSIRELEEVRRTAAVVCKAFHSIAALLSEASIQGEELWVDGAPLRVGRLRSEVAVLFAKAGLEQPMGNIVAVGAKAAVPHTQGESPDVVKQGEALVVDLFPRENLFADCTRTFCVGQPNDRLTTAHDYVCEALIDAQARARIGIKASELQHVVCSRFEKGGYDTPRSKCDPQQGYVHNLGHGVGYELHEFPTFADSDAETGRLEAGDLFTLEPGLYEPSQGFGVRLEDLCYLREDGLEVLTDLPYDLNPRAWV
jgi:Xaa-Pro aminopeptidase